MEKITYNKVYDEKGDFKYIEMHQGANVICVSMATSGTHTAGYRWDEIKSAIDKLSPSNKTSLVESIEQLEKSILSV